MKDIAIIIPCYKRIDTLQGLLNSLLKAKYDKKVDLVFSIDYSGNDEVGCFAERFVWPYGEKKLIKYQENIGLRQNIISCGDMTEKYDAVIVLEDDLVVSPLFFEYASKACDFYWDDECIAGISLYSYRYTETRREFFPETMGYDTYFIQWTSSWGQLWTRKQWNGFRRWYDEHHDNLDEYHIPSYVKHWKNSWKKYNIAYLSDTNKYYVYPIQSYSTMVRSIGTHIKKVDLRNPFIVPLASALPREWMFQSVKGSIKYDSFFELQSIELEINGQKELVSFDIYCEKEKRDINCNYYITSQRHKEDEPLISWGRSVLPIEQNVTDAHTGEGLYLYRTSNYNAARLSPEDKRALNVDMPVKELIMLAFRKLFRSVLSKIGI